MNTVLLNIMRIGIDLRPLQGESQYRGIGRVIDRTVEPLLSMLETEDSVIFFVDKDTDYPDIVKRHKMVEVIEVPTKFFGKVKYLRALLPTHTHINPSLEVADVLLQFDASYGISTHIPCVVFFHDLIPYLFRKEEIKKIGRNGIMGVKDNIARELYWKKYKKTLSRYKQARRIIAISKSSKKDILKYIPEISKNDVSVTYLGVDSLSNIDHTQKISSKIKFILRHQYLLYVGGIDTRKNITKLLSDFFELKKDYPNMKAVFIGKEFGLTGQLDALGWNRILAQHKQDKDSILIPGYVNDAELRELYKNAIAFVFPSRYEGFGLPVLEAMQYGCPVIAYNNSSIPEVAGKASLLLKDGTSLIPGIKKIIEEPATRNRLVKYGKERVVSFSWEKTALEVYSTIKLIVGSN